MGSVDTIAYEPVGWSTERSAREKGGSCEDTEADHG